MQKIPVTNTAMPKINIGREISAYQRFDRSVGMGSDMLILARACSGRVRAGDVRMTGLKITSTSTHEARFCFFSMHHPDFGSRKSSRIFVASSRRRYGFARKASFASTASCSRVWSAKPDT